MESAAREENAKARAAESSEEEEELGVAKLTRVPAVESGARMESAEAEDAAVMPSLMLKPLHKRLPLLLLQPQLPLLLFEAVTWYKRANDLSLSQLEFN